MSYTAEQIERMTDGAKAAALKPVKRYGVSVYVDTDADWCGPDFIVYPEDEEGLKIFREFAGKLLAHYNTLKK